MNEVAYSRRSQSDLRESAGLARTTQKRLNSRVPEDRETDSSNRYTTETLMPQVYDELKRLASFRMKNQQVGHSISGTALLHDAYVRLNAEKTGPRWANRKHFFGAASEAMRRILIDRIRAKQRLKRGGDYQHTALDEVEIVVPAADDKLMAINEALDDLQQVYPDEAEVVKLRFFDLATSDSFRPTQ